jgi:hypothetical protein
MALPLFKEKRFTPRKKLTGLLPGRLAMKETGEELLCKLVDVSKHGIGLTTKVDLQYGATVVLHTDSKVITFKVAWIQQDFGKQDLFRIGLLCSDTNLDIVEIFTSEGCLK